MKCVFLHTVFKLLASTVSDDESDGDEISGLSDVSWSGESESDCEYGPDHEPSRKSLNHAVQTACVLNISSIMTLMPGKSPKLIKLCICLIIL